MKTKSFYSFVSLCLVSVLTCSVFAQPTEKVVVEVEVANVPDGTVLKLYELLGPTQSVAATDTVRDGKFVLEFAASDNAPHPCTIFLDKMNLFVDDIVWVMPGAKVTVKGSDPNPYTWEITSNLDVQQTENKFVEGLKDELAESVRLTSDYSVARVALSDPKLTKEQSDSLIQRLRAINAEQQALYVRMSEKEFKLMETLTPDESWLTHMSDCLDIQTRIANNPNALETGRRLFERVSEQYRATDIGKTVYNKLNPPTILKAGDVLPDVVMVDTLGNEHRFSELRGKYVLIDLWSAGCGPCIMSIPELKEIAQTMADSLAVVSISIDAPVVWRRASARYKLSGNNWNDLKGETGIYSHFDVMGIPFYCFVSPEGRIIDFKMGYSKGVLKYSVVPMLIARRSQVTKYTDEGNTRTVEYPEVGEEQMDFVVLKKVEMTNESTRLTLRAYAGPGMKFLISSESNIVTDTGVKLNATSANGLTFDTWIDNESESPMEFTLTFPPLPEGVKSFSYYEEHNKPNECWRLVDVKVVE